MATIDPSKIIPVVDVYRLIRDEVPLGRILAPALAWALIAAALIWCGGVIWRGIGAPILHMGQLTPASRSIWDLIGSWLLAGILSLSVLKIDRSIRGLLAIIDGLHQRLTALEKRPPI